LLDEWELLGCVVGPPLLALFRGRLPAGLVRSCDLAGHVGRQVRVAGVVATYRDTQTAGGRDMQFISLEDEWGLSEITLFPGTCPPLPHLRLGPYVATGIVEESLGVYTVNAHDVSLPR
jgi:DNA polymerase III alpha subunit